MSTYTSTGASQPIQLDENNNFIDHVTGELMHQLTVEEMPSHTFGAELYVPGKETITQTECRSQNRQRIHTMNNKAYERAFNIAIKYGFCSDCVQDLDKGRCHECDCYQSAVKVIRDALEKLDAIEESKATVWHDTQNDPPKENGEYLCYYEYFRYGNYNRMYRTMDRGQFFNGQWGGEPTHGTNTKVLAWTELQFPESPEVKP